MSRAHLGGGPQDNKKTGTGGPFDIEAPVPDERKYPMRTYVLALDCETCGEQMRTRVGDLTAAPDDELVIDLAMTVSQTDFECQSCGGVTYTGDFEDMCHHEPGEAAS